MEAKKYGVVVPVSENSLSESADFGRVLAESFGRLLNATPQQRAQWAAEFEVRQAERKELRARERAETETVPLTLDALTAKLGYERGYAEHLVQPYCTCEETFDGWSYCDHARDLGWTY